MPSSIPRIIFDESFIGYSFLFVFSAS